VSVPKEQNSAAQGGYSRTRKLAIYSIGAGAFISGVLWLLFHHFLVIEGEFGAERNLLEAWWLKVHGAFAFAAIGLFGWMWGTHITRAWPASRRRWSGTSFTALFAWLILSGYLLYYLGADRPRSIVSVLHWGLGLAAPLLIFWHKFDRRRESPKE
jgi:hypothetical protein